MKRLARGRPGNDADGVGLIITKDREGSEWSGTLKIRTSRRAGKAGEGKIGFRRRAEATLTGWLERSFLDGQATLSQKAQALGPGRDGGG